MDRKLILLNVMFATSLVTANVLAGKIVSFGEYVVLPAAVVTYAFTFLITDIIGELYGKKKAAQAVMFGFIAQAFASVMILMGKYLPVAPFAQETQQAYETLLGQNWRFVVASLVAYLAAQNLDVWLFHFIREKTGVRHKWLRNNASTMSAQFVDTAIFITIAFWGVVPNLWAMIVSQYVVKVGLALLDTPFFYLFTKVRDRYGTRKTIEADTGSAKTAM